MAGGDADRVDQADVQLAGNDRRRHEAAAGDTDDCPELFVETGKTPGKSAGIAVELVPGDGKGFIGKGHVVYHLVKIVDGFG